MRTLLRVTDNKVYHILDWSTNRVDSISEEDMLRRLKMSFSNQGYR